MSLQKILENKTCFKLVCGAGNEDAEEVEKIVALYACAGANYFDLSAKPEVVLAARRALDERLPTAERNNYYLNVSVGIKGDPHVRKARINAELCISCGACEKACTIQEAISAGTDTYQVNATRCIGCGKCMEVCPVKAITFFSENIPLEAVLPPLISLGLDSLELHAVTEDEEGAYAQWQIMTRLFPGMLSLCLDRSHLGDKQLLSRIDRFISGRGEYTTIIQADGAPMSGSDDKPSTTLQALATANVVDKAKLPVWIMLSGGTNSKTAELAQYFEITAHGVAIGSYARKIVKEYIDRDDFLTNKAVFEKALVIAKDLVAKTLKYMG